MDDWFFDLLPQKLFSKLPVELWLKIKMFYIIQTLESTLKFPKLVLKRVNHDMYADFFQATLGPHQWDIETGGPSLTSLISYYYKGKRFTFDWTGMTMISRERVFGIGFNIDETFLNMIFMDDDYWNFENIYDFEDSAFLQIILSLEE